MKFTEEEFQTICCALYHWQLVLRGDRLSVAADKRAEYDRKIQKVRNLEARVRRAKHRSRA